MKMCDDLSRERAIARLEYDPETGIFIWKNGRRASGVAGCFHRHGYIQIWIDGTAYLAHRLAFLIVFGRWPEHGIDHVNGDPSDNRMLNLCEATHSENH